MRDADADRRGEEQGTTETRARKPYRSPELIVHGPVRELTQGHATTFNDSGAGKALHSGS